MRLLGKQSSSNSAVPEIALAIPCIIELLAQPGPAHQGTVVCLCPRDHETHSNKKASVTVSVEEENAVALTFIQLCPSPGYCTLPR